MNHQNLLACFYEAEEVSPFEERLAAMTLEGIAGEIEDRVNFIARPALSSIIEHSQLHVELILVTVVGDELMLLAPGRNARLATLTQEVSLAHYPSNSAIDNNIMGTPPFEEMFTEALYDLAVNKLSFIPTQTNPDLPFEPIPLNISRIVGYGSITGVGAYINTEAPHKGTTLVAMMEVPRAIVDGHAKSYFAHSDEPCELLSFDQIDYHTGEHTGLTRLVEYFNSDQVEEPIKDVARWWMNHPSRY